MQCGPFIIYLSIGKYGAIIAVQSAGNIPQIFTSVCNAGNLPVDHRFCHGLEYFVLGGVAIEYFVESERKI